MKAAQSFKWIFTAVGLALFIRLVVISVLKVPTATMAPSLMPGDFIIASKLSYGLKFPWQQEGYFESIPQVGDIVVFKLKNKPGSLFVKRIIAQPGDSVQIVQSILKINNSPCEYKEINRTDLSLEVFAAFEEKCPGQPLRQVIRGLNEQILAKSTELKTVPPDEYYLLGDNRETSEDSRQFGTVHRDQIIGKVKMVAVSVSSTQDSISKEKGFRSDRFLTFVY